VAPLDREALPLLAAQVEYRAWARRLSDYLDGAAERAPAAPAAESTLLALSATRGLCNAVQLQASQLLMAHRRGRRTAGGRASLSALLAQLGAEVAGLLENRVYLKS